MLRCWRVAVREPLGTPDYVIKESLKLFSFTTEPQRSLSRSTRLTALSLPMGKISSAPIGRRLRGAPSGAEPLWGGAWLGEEMPIHHKKILLRVLSVSNESCLGVTSGR